jgi:CRISPR-associated endonuclease/helicase Cas3
MELSPADFATFFTEVYDVPPFPWQNRLLEQVAAQGRWPDLLDLPTGSGKTAALDIAVFHLALEAAVGLARRAPLRIAFVVDRRLVVDDAFDRAKKLVERLSTAETPIVRRVAEALRKFGGDKAPPLIAQRLRGGVPLEDDWVRTPCQPTILCSTVDQVGSRLLFRGYGVSPAMAPIHAGLLGSDCLLLLDEAHLAEPLRQTVQAIASLPSLRGPDARPVQVAMLSATAANVAGESFTLAEDDRAAPGLARRLVASKLATLKRIEGKRQDAIALEAVRAVETLLQSGATAPAVGVVVNRVARAREVFETLRADNVNDWQIELLIGPARAADRDEVAQTLRPVKTGTNQEPRLPKPLLIIATQTIEAGVDLDLDGLVTEAAALDALRQRFGRLNRGGRAITPYAAILAAVADLKPGDPVYGDAIGATWKALGGDGAVVDFGISAFAGWLEAAGLAGDAMAPLLTGKRDAPVLMPAYVDLWSQTSPVPECDPEPALFLHGTGRDPDAVQIIWRADVEPGRSKDELAEMIALAPPRAAEAIELPLWAVRAWLSGRSFDLADIASGEQIPDQRAARRRNAFRWAGIDHPRTQFIRPADISPGDTILVPSETGGCDGYGWNPDSTNWTDDVYEKASQPFAQRRFILRVTEGLVIQAVLRERGEGESIEEAKARGRRMMQRICAAMDDLGDSPKAREVMNCLHPLLPAGMASLMDRFEPKSHSRPAFPWRDAEDRRLAVVLIGSLPAAEAEQRDGSGGTTEDDVAASMTGVSCTLLQHAADVCKLALEFADRAGLPTELAADVALAAWMHDAGKVDRRFQRFLAGGDPFAVDDQHVLAKSAEGRSPRGTWERSGLPPAWRHEALSVRLALVNPRLVEANDRDLVLWLIGTHHGRGRPFFPHADLLDGRDRRLPDIPGLVPSMLKAGAGPQTLGFELDGLDWATLFALLRRRYGPWGLARLEAVLRLADHRASEMKEADNAAA